MRIVVALFCACVAVPTEAATFYYVGGTYQFANLRSLKDPMFSYGEMTIDESKLPEGQTLANLRVDFRVENDENVHPYGMTLRLHNAAGEVMDLAKADGWFYWESGSYMEFDENGRPKNWSIRPRYEQASFSGRNGAGRDSDIEYTSDIDPFGENSGREFLKQRGYREGTKTFEKLLNDHVWAEGFGTRETVTGGEGEGRWYTDALEFARKIAERTSQALSGSRSNFFKIPECRAPKA